MLGFGESNFFKKPKEEPVEEAASEESIINEEPPMSTDMATKSKEAIADLEKQLGGELPPPLSDEEAEKKLQFNTDRDGMSAAQKRKEKEEGA